MGAELLLLPDHQPGTSPYTDASRTLVPAGSNSMNKLIVLLLGATATVAVPLSGLRSLQYYDGLSNSYNRYSTNLKTYQFPANQEATIKFTTPWYLPYWWRAYVGSVFVYRIQTASNYIIQAKCKCTNTNSDLYFSTTGDYSSSSNYQKYSCDDKDFDIASASNYFQALLYPIQWHGQDFECRLKSVPSTDVTTGPTTSTVTPDTNDCACGRRNTRSDRIVNGEETDPNEYPFYAALTRYSGSQVFCGGSIIAKKWIMTAAHCVDFITDNSDYEVDVGSHSRESPSPYQRTHQIEQIIIHPQWDSTTVDNDIALIKLTTEISYNSKVGPVCLPFNVDYSNLDQKPSIVMGYGVTETNGFQTTTLHDVTLSIESRADCRKYNDKYRDEVTNNMLCTYTSDKDACQGDSGGPLVYSTGGNLVQIGVVSWGQGCAKENNPGVYSYVRNYLDSNWIQGTTGEDFCQV